MKPNNGALVALTAIALMLTAASCGGSDGPSSLYAGGTNGLIFNFEEGAPPDLIYDNGQTPMTIIMRVKNDGEFDTQDLRVRFSGISSNDFTDLPDTSTPTNRYTGKALIQDDLIEGSEAFLEIGEATFTRSLRGGGSLDYTLHADACYGYATVGTAQVCFESNYNDADETCDPDSSSLEVSGGPVQISNLETNAIGGNILRISFDIEKANNVEIWKPTGTQICNPPDRARIAAEKDWVYVRVDDGFEGQSIISCSNLLDSDGSDGNVIFGYPQEYRESLNAAIRRDDQGYVRIANGPASVTCTARIPSGSDGESTIDIALAYYVEDRISHPFTVVHTDAVDSMTP